MSHLERSLWYVRISVQVSLLDPINPDNLSVSLKAVSRISKLNHRHHPPPSPCHSTS